MLHTRGTAVLLALVLAPCPVTHSSSTAPVRLDRRLAEHTGADDDVGALLGFGGGGSLGGWRRGATAPCGASADCHGGRYSSNDCPGGWSGIKSCAGGRVRVVRLSRERTVSGDVARLCGSPALASLISLELASTATTGDVGALAGCQHLGFLDLHSSQVGGRIDRLGLLTELTYINLAGTRVEGDVAQLSGLAGLTFLHLASSLVGGDVGRLSGLRALTDLHLDGCPNVWGDASGLAVASMDHEHFYHDSCRPRVDCDPSWEVCGHACGCGVPAGGTYAIGSSDAACCSCEVVEHGSCPSPVAGDGDCTCDAGYSGERCDAHAGAGAARTCVVDELARLTGSSCPRAIVGAITPDTCPGSCATVFTEWWRSCSRSDAVVSLGRSVEAQLQDFNQRCSAALAAAAGAGAAGSGH